MPAAHKTPAPKPTKGKPFQPRASTKRPPEPDVEYLRKRAQEALGSAYREDIFNKVVSNGSLVRKIGKPRVLEAPYGESATDADGCFTREDGICISKGPCMHSPRVVGVDFAKGVDASVKIPAEDFRKGKAIEINSGDKDLQDELDELAQNAEIRNKAEQELGIPETNNRKEKKMTFGIGGKVTVDGKHPAVIKQIKFGTAGLRYLVDCKALKRGLLEVDPARCGGSNRVRHDKQEVKS